MSFSPIARIIGRRVCLFLGCCLMFTLATVYADSTRAYHGLSGKETTHTDWMKWVPDDTLLSAMSIPGTHESVSFYGGSLPQCQSMSLLDQLNSGLRYFDIRYRYLNDRLHVVHGLSDQKASFEGVLMLMDLWLQQHPTETILLNASTDGVPEEDLIDRDYLVAHCSLTKGQIREYYKTNVVMRRVWTTEGLSHPDDARPTLGDLRGKIYIVRGSDWPTGNANGYDVQHMNMWNLRSVGDYDIKWGYAMLFWMYANGNLAAFPNCENAGDSDCSHLNDPDNPHRIYLNDTAASSGNIMVYPMYAAQYVNKRALEYLFQRNATRTAGTVRMDFPGAGLISAILAHNMKHISTPDQVTSMSDDFNQMWSDIVYNADYGRDSASERAKALKDWLGFILPAHKWGVIATGKTDSDDWGHANATDGINVIASAGGWYYLAVNALSLNSGVTSAELKKYLDANLVQSPLSGTASQRASTLQARVKGQFPGVNWNVVVRRNAKSSDWSALYDSSAAYFSVAFSGGDVYTYDVWATSNFNLPPVPDIGGPYTVAEGTPLQLDATGTTDPDTTALTYDWDIQSDGAIELSTPQADPVLTFPQEGRYPLTLTVFDGVNKRSANTTVVVTNVPPALYLGAPVSVLTGTTWTRNGWFEDPGADTWKVSVNYGDGTPTQAVTPVNKRFTLTRLASTAGTNTVTVTVDDGTVTVTNKFVVTAVTLQPEQIYSFEGPGEPVAEGIPLTVTGTFHANSWTDSQVTIAWDDGTPDTVATVTGNKDFTFKATHTYGKNRRATGNIYNAVATVGNIGSRVCPVTVVNAQPVLTSITLPPTISEGQLFSVGYSFTDSGTDTRLLSVNWGDATSVTVVAASRTGTTPPHRYNTAGNYKLTLRVTDDDGATSVLTNTVTVLDAVPQIIEFYPTIVDGVEGGSATVQGRFTSPNLANDTFVVNINWGDGVVTPVKAVLQGQVAFFEGTHVYLNNNGVKPWSVVATVTDHNGSLAQQSLTLPIANVAPTLLVASQWWTPSATPLIGSGAILDPGNDQFTGLVDFGDGTPIAPLNISGYGFEWEHQYPSNGLYTLTLQVKDQDGAIATKTNTVSVLVGPLRNLLVTNTNDSGPGSLRQAVMDVNQASAGNVFSNSYSEIHFAPALAGQTILITNGTLSLSNKLSIDASDLPVGITLSGNGTAGLFQVSSGASIVFDSLTFTKGGGLSGGAISSEGNMTLNRCVLTGNTSTGPGGSMNIISGRATLNNCTLYANRSAQSAGGAISNPGGALTLNQCTLTGNSGTRGGAISYGVTGGTLSLYHCTVTGNTASQNGGAVVSASPACYVQNSIVSGNRQPTGPDIYAVVVLSGVNLTTGDPQLLPLGSYGGPVPTMPPRLGSIAIDAIKGVNLGSPIAPLAYWRLGESDAAALAGASTTSTTNEVTNALSAPLTFNLPVQYIGAVSPSAAGWLGSRLGVQLTAGTYATQPLLQDTLGSTEITDNFGIELWVKPSSLSGVKCLAYNGDSSSSGWGLYQLDGTYRGLLGGVAFVGSAPVVLGTWTHLALVRDGGKTTLYLNGVPSGSVDATPNLPAGQFAVGARPQLTSEEHFDGALDEIRVFTFNPGQFDPGLLLFQPVSTAGLSSTFSTDQRGSPRVSNGAADMGAVEVQQDYVRLNSDSGNGSLRQTVATVGRAAIVRFANSLAGQSIGLNSPIALQNNMLWVEGDGLAAGVTLDAHSRPHRLLDVAAGVAAQWRDVNFAGGGLGNAIHGGAILNLGSLTLDRCSFFNNSGSQGGALFNEAGGTLTLQRCTIARNQAVAGSGVLFNRGTVSILDSTISGNIGGFALVSDVSSITKLSGSIIAGNGVDFDIANRGALTRQGGNLVQRVQDLGTTEGPDFIVGGPLLAPLGNYGGLTLTRPLLPGSPAIDAGASALDTDQRGAARVRGSASDLGSVEAFPFSSIPLVDSDGDGADDRMELGYFGNLFVVTANSDLDGDGSKDLSEFLNMTNPLDAADNLRITSFKAVAGTELLDQPQFNVTVRTFPGLSYSLEGSATPGGFTGLDGTRFTASASSTTIKASLTPGQGFVRAKLESVAPAK